MADKASKSSRFDLCVASPDILSLRFEVGDLDIQFDKAGNSLAISHSSGAKFTLTTEGISTWGPEVARTLLTWSQIQDLIARWPELMRILEPKIP